MSDIITLTGVVGTEPKRVATHSGLAMTSFRLACTQRRFDRATNSWVDSGTNWYSISSFRRLAENVGSSLRVGDHVVVGGRLRVDQWASGEKKGTSVSVDADFVGHDLSWGTTRLLRNAPMQTLAAPGTTDEIDGPLEDEAGERWEVEPSDDGFLPSDVPRLAAIDS